MSLSPEEQAQRKRLDELYVRAQSPVMLSIERSVCGCDYGGTSWTTRAEAQQIATLLRLRPSMRLLDVGAGSGWPGLFMTKTSGCDVVLVDLPLTGIRIAAERAGKDRMPGAFGAVVADAAILPFPRDSFDAITHSDLLCCLRQKRDALKACREVIRDDGRMAFTVISVAPGLSPGKYKEAVANGPEFIEAEADYPTLLAQADWTVVECRDITAGFGASCRRQIQADTERKDALEACIGASEFAERQLSWRSKLAAIEEGILRRELFIAIPGRA